MNKDYFFFGEYR